jgi:Swiss Army Knife protein, DSP-PTPase phosphatase domain
VTAALRLLPPGAHTGFLGDLCVPDDLYWIARAPVALAGMSYPGRADWKLLHEHGIGHVVCLSSDRPGYDPAPCSLTAIRLQDLVSGCDPDDPDQERTFVEQAAADVVAQLDRGIGVAVHCMGGRGRTGTVIGTALVRLGHDPHAVVEHLDRVAKARGRRGWPESPWQAAVVRSAG